MASVPALPKEAVEERPRTTVGLSASHAAPYMKLSIGFGALSNETF
jgi:hypothetical protein